MSDLTAAARLFGADPEALTGLGAFESDVYRFDGPHGPAVLKVMPQGHRSASQVRGEVDWLLALVEAGVPVARPVPSQAGRWVEELDDGTVLVAFAAAPGSLTRPTDWSAARVTAWGELLGRLQAHGRAWRPAEVRRRPLLEHTYLIRAAELVPDDPGFVAAVAELMPAAEALLGDGPDAGLVHADLHHGNLLLHEERWTAIDFDDCAYGSYAFDLAMPLYYAIFSERDVPADVAAGRFLPPFLRGFRRHAPDPEGGAEAVALSLTLRHAELVAALRSKLGTDLDGERWSDPYRRAERSMRQTVIEGRETLTVAELRRWLP